MVNVNMIIYNKNIFNTMKIKGIELIVRNFIELIFKK